ncbi:MAG: FmdB family zinc ribbon protein [Acidobacteriota bacterium]
MPLYEYSCKSCGARFEILQHVGAGGEGLTCPKCGSAEVAKQFSTFAASMSGSGSAMPCGASSSAGCGSGGFS